MLHFLVSVSQQHTIPYEERGRVLQPHLSEQQINMDIQQQERQHEDWGWLRPFFLCFIQ